MNDRARLAVRRERTLHEAAVAQQARDEQKRRGKIAERKRVAELVAQRRRRMA